MTAKEIRGKIAKVEEEELEKKNSLGRDQGQVYRRFKQEMKEEDYSGSLPRVNGVVESENKQLKSRRELLADKKGGVCGMQ